MAFENSTERNHQSDKDQSVPRLTLLPDAKEYQTFGASVMAQRAEATTSLVNGGIINELQIDFGDQQLPTLMDYSRTNLATQPMPDAKTGLESKTDASQTEMSNSMSSQSIDNITAISDNFRKTETMPSEFGTLMLCDSSNESLKIAQLADTKDPAFKDVEAASLFELYRISRMPDHGTAGVEYNAIVGINAHGDIKATSLHKSKVDNPFTSYVANTSAAYEIGGDKVPTVLIHSHPRIFENGQERPWWYFSPTDVTTIESQSKNYANPKMEGYILGPDNQVLEWKPGGKTITEGQYRWGVPTMIGKFDKDGNFTPLKKPVEFDHNMQPPESAYDNGNKIPASKFESWRKEQNAKIAA